MQNRPRIMALLLLTACVTLSCASAPRNPTSPTGAPVQVAPSVLTNPELKAEETDQDQLLRSQQEQREVAKIQRSKDITPLEAPSKSKPRKEEEPVLSETKYVQVSFDSMPLNQFVLHVFGDVLGVNYLTSDQVSQNTTPVTLNLKNPVSESRLYDLAKETLGRLGIDIVYREGVFYIWPMGQKASDVRLGVGRTRDSIPETPAEILQLIPIQFGDINDLVALIKDALKINVQAYPKENVIAVRGTRSQIESVLDFLSVTDRPAMRGRHVALFMLTYWDLNDFLPALAESLAQEGIPVSAQAGGNGVLLMPLAPINGFVVFAAEKSWLERARYWVQSLDIPNRTQEKTYFIYIPKYSTAKDMADSLSTIVGVGKPVTTTTGPGRSSSKSNRQQSSTQTGPGSRGGFGSQTGTGGGGGLGNRVAYGAQQPAAEVPAQWSATQEGKKPEGEGGPSSLAPASMMSDIQFAVDQSRNAIIFYCTAQAYSQMLSLLQRLDQMPVQVMIDATVVEVTLTGSLAFGFQWNSIGKEQKPGSDHNSIWGNTAVGLATGSLNLYGLFDKANIQVQLSALASKNLIKVLSNPKLTVRDGKTASITVGTEVPVLTGQATSQEATSTYSTVEYRNTGVMLQVTPYVNSLGVVTLNINQEVSDASNNKTSNINSPVILTRSITTEVVTGDGQTVVLGGLIKENKSDGDTHVPGAGNIPLLGWLFKNESKGLDRTELMVLITPRIIRSTTQIDIVRKEIMDSFESIGGQ